MERAFASPMATTEMGKSQFQFTFLNMGSENPTNSNTPSLHSDQRHALIAKRLRDALFSAVTAKYVNNDSDNHSLPFTTERIKSEIERRLHESLPSFHTPTHLPYASMIQRAIVELGEDDGLNEELISDFIKKEYEDLPWAHTAILCRHLGKLCESGELEKSKCGKYKFKTEDKGVKRKKQQGKAAGRSRLERVQSRYGIEDFDEKKQSSSQIIVGLLAQEALTIEVTNEQSCSLREEIDRDEVGDHTKVGQIGVLDKVEEVNEDEIIDERFVDADESRGGVDDLVVKRQSQSEMIVGICAKEAVTVEGTGEQSSSLREEINVAEVGDHAQEGQVGVIDKLKEDEISDEHPKDEVESRGGVEDLNGMKHYRSQIIIGLCAEEAPTIEETGEQSSSLREEVDVAEGDHIQGGQIEVPDELEEDEMIDVSCEEEEQGEVVEESMEELPLTTMKAKKVH